VVVYGSEYWKKVFNLDALVDAGTISPKDLELFQFADSPDQAFELLRAGLTKNHLAVEAAGGTPTGEDQLEGWAMEDFLGLESGEMDK